MPAEMPHAIARFTSACVQTHPEVIALPCFVYTSGVAAVM